MKASAMYTRLILSALAFCFLIACTQGANAERPRAMIQQPMRGFDATSMDLDEIIQALDLNTQSCLQFVDATSVHFRKERWSAALHHMWKAQPDAVTQWIIGSARPPLLVTEEAERQKNCMLSAMIVDAARPETDLVVHWGDETHTKSHMTAIYQRFERDPRFRQNLLSWITRSDYRDAREQSYIWHRKFIFQSNPFNRVSTTAATRCGLLAGRTWDPANSRHQDCWGNRLSAAEREQEILIASAAPGISRHHWGTDFDLFSLNPRNFLPGARMHDEYMWMKTHGVHFGFAQPYVEHDHPHAYMEERWHWTYLPIGQALTQFIQMHSHHFEKALNDQWDLFESRWNGRHRTDRPFFGHVRAHWRDYMLHVNHTFETP